MIFLFPFKVHHFIGTLCYALWQQNENFMNFFEFFLLIYPICDANLWQEAHLQNSVAYNRLLSLLEVSHIQKKKTYPVAWIWEADTNSKIFYLNYVHSWKVGTLFTAVLLYFPALNMTLNFVRSIIWKWFNWIG